MLTFSKNFCFADENLLKVETLCFPEGLCPVLNPFRGPKDPGLKGDGFLFTFSQTDIQMSLDTIFSETSVKVVIGGQRVNFTQESLEQGLRGIQGKSQQQ